MICSKTTDTNNYIKDSINIIVICKLYIKIVIHNIICDIINRIPEYLSFNTKYHVIII